NASLSMDNATFTRSNVSLSTVNVPLSLSNASLSLSNETFTRYNDPLYPGESAAHGGEEGRKKDKNSGGVAGTPPEDHRGTLQECGVGSDGDFAAGSAAVVVSSTDGGGGGGVGSGVDVSPLARPRKTFRWNSASFGELGP